MKKIISILFIFILLLITSCNSKETTTKDSTITTNDLYNYQVLYDGTTVLTKYKGNDNDIIIPEYIDDKKVVGIASGCYNENLIINSIYLSKYIKAFNPYAHYGLTFNNINIDNDNIYFYVDNNCLVETNTKKVILGNKDGYIPDDIEIIGSYSYYDINNINVILKTSILEIESYAYGANLESIVLNSGLKKLDKYALFLTNITNINIPSSIELIDINSLGKNINNIELETNDKYELLGNSIVNKKTKELVIGFNNSIIDSKVVSIGDYAFSFLEGITNIVIPSNVVKIGDYVFLNSSIETIKLPDEIEEFGNGIFKSSNLKNVILPYGIKEINEEDFYDCKNLEYIVIPYSVTKINSPFIGCDKLDKLFIKSSKINFKINGDKTIYNKLKKYYYTSDVNNVYNDDSLWALVHGVIYTKDNIY